MKRFVFFFVLLSCQPIEIIEPVVFDNDQLSSISINAKNIEIQQTYEPKFIDPYIDHSLEHTSNRKNKILDSNQCKYFW